MAAMASKKESYGSRPPPPPISQSTAPIQIYDVIEELPEPQVRVRNHQQQQQQQQQQNRRSVPPAPLADEDKYDYIGADAQEGEYVDTEYQRGRQDIHSEPQDRHYQDAQDKKDRHYQDAQDKKKDRHYQDEQDKRRSQEAYYVDTAAPNRNSAYQSHGTQDHYQARYETAPPGPYPQDIYEAPFDDEYYDRRGYPSDYQERKPVDRRESRKKMGVAIMAGLNTARVKEVKQRLRPAFGPEEVIDSIERRPPADEDVEPIDVSGMSIAARMKLLEAKQQRPAPPPTYPKPRPPRNTGAAAGGAGGGAQGHPTPAGSGGGVQLPYFGVDVPASGAVDIRRHPVDSPSPRGSPQRSPGPSNRISLDDAPWFFGNFEQHRCEEKLRNLNKEGAFVIRISKKGESRSQPFTLCIFHDNDVYNLMIREKMNQKYAVGSEKSGEPEFGSLADLVKFHADIPIEVISKTEAGRATGVWLTMSPLK